MKHITAKGILKGLTGVEDSISGNRAINFFLTVDKFKDENGVENIDEVYLISELSDSNITISNLRNNKSLPLSFHSNGSPILVNSNKSFVAEVNKPQLQYISDYLLTSDLQINWNINWLGFISYKNNADPFLGSITISNIGWSDTKVSRDDFNDKVWSKISGEERYFVSIRNVSSSMFQRAPDEVNEWKSMMTDRAKIIEQTMRKFERAENPNDFATIARDLKAIYDKMDEVTRKSKENLNGLLFNKLFSGSGVSEASMGMMEGIIKIMEGMEKISNQIGHTATLNKIPFNYIGDKDTVMTFLFISALFFNFMSKNL